MKVHRKARWMRALTIGLLFLAAALAGASLLPRQSRAMQTQKTPGMLTEDKLVFAVTRPSLRLAGQMRS